MELRKKKRNTKKMKVMCKGDDSTKDSTVWSCWVSSWEGDKKKIFRQEKWKDVEKNGTNEFVSERGSERVSA